MLVGSYPTFSPLPSKVKSSEDYFAAPGGLFSVALSLISRPVGVTDHPALRSPDFPLVNKSTSDRLTNSVLDSNDTQEGKKVQQCTLFCPRCFSEKRKLNTSRLDSVNQPTCRVRCWFWMRR